MTSSLDALKRTIATQDKELVNQKRNHDTLFETVRQLAAVYEAQLASLAAHNAAI